MSPERAMEARLRTVRARLQRARTENLNAVAAKGDAESMSSSSDDEAGADLPSRRDGGLQRGRRGRGSKRARGEQAYTKSMRARVARMHGEAVAAGRVAASRAEAVERGEEAVVVYGGAGKLKEGAAERVAEELEGMERRKMRRRSNEVFDEDKDDIGFINEHNRQFNKILNQHYDKYESVREIKDCLERGTALP